MSHQSLIRVMDRYTNDAAFREQVRRDPQSAIDRGGFNLSEHERELVASMDWSLPDEHLKERVSKSCLVCGF